MPSIPNTEDEALAFLRKAGIDWLGHFGEAIWDHIVKASGWNMISLARICEGGAPLARGQNGKTILPDFEAYRGGKSVFVEAKAKTQSIVYCNKKQERHGINENNYVHYRQIEKDSGKPCCIAIVELWREDRSSHELYWSGSLLFEKLSELFDPRSEYPEIPPKVYWPRKQWRELESGLTALELFRIAHEIDVPSFEFELDQILFPAKQKALF